MVIYEYLCKFCSYAFEDTTTVYKCPHCSNSSLSTQARSVSNSAYNTAAQRIYTKKQQAASQSASQSYAQAAAAAKAAQQAAASQNTQYTASQYAQSASAQSSRGSAATPPANSGTAACQIWWDTAAQIYYISLPWRKEFVDTIKTLIPPVDRQYDDFSKQWTFTKKYLPAMEFLVRRLFHGSVHVTTEAEVETKRKQATAPSAVAKATLDQVMLQFFKLLTHSAAKRAYLLSLAEHHPDKGGDTETAASLNSMWDRLEKEHFKR